MNESFLVQALTVPAAVGLICWMSGRHGRRFAFWLALLSSAWTAWIAWRVYRTPGLTLVQPWFQVADVALGLVLRPTTLGAFIGFAVAGFTLLVTLYSGGYLPDRMPASRYYAYMQWTLTGALTALYADNLLLLLIGWEVVTLMLFLLVNLGGSESAAKGAMKSFVMLGLADCAMLAAMALLWATGATPGLLISEIPAGGLELGLPMRHLAYILLLAGALAKAGAMPFHTWVPAAAEGAPASVMAFLPASLDKLLGIYLLALISLRMFVVDEAMRLLLLIIGAVTVIGAVMMAMIQHDLKKLLSFHAVSQVGYMVLGIGTGLWIGVIGGLFHMLNHAIYKCCLFLSAGAVERGAGTSDLDRLGGLGRAMPVTFACCAVAAFSISGVPPFNGFASKWMVYQGLLASTSRLAPLALVAAVFGSALTLASFVKVLHAVFAGPMSSSAAARKPREVGLRMLVPMLVLAALCVVLGLWYALPSAGVLGPAVSKMGANVPAAEVGAAWSPLSALALIIVGLAAGLLIYAIGRAFRARRSRTFVCGEVLPTEPMRASGTGFYATIRGLPIVRGFYNDAERQAFDVYRVGGRFGGTLVETLRGFHTGMLPLYVSWCLLGLMVLIAFLIHGR